MANVAFPLDFVKTVAGAFAGAPAVRYEDSACYVVEWERDDMGLTAGVVADAGGASVFLASAACEVDSPGQAIAVLKKIFADEIVAVTAFQKEVAVFCELARTEDPSGGFNERSLAHIDQVEIRSWTGAGDAG